MCVYVWNDVCFQEKDTALHLAAKNGHLSVLQKIVDVGVDLDEKNLVSTFNEMKITQVLLFLSLEILSCHSHQAEWSLWGLEDNWFYLMCLKGSHTRRVSVKSNILLGPISNFKVSHFLSVVPPLIQLLELYLYLIILLSPFFSLTLVHSSA